MTNKITTKQQEILKLLYKYKFLDRKQIQAFLNHKYHKRINDWLKDLTQKEYLNRIYSNKFGENTKPAIYYLGLNGIRFLKTQDDCSIEVLRKFYRLKDRSTDFIEKCQLVGEIALGLKIAANRSRESSEENELSYLIATATDLANSEYRFNFLTEYKVDPVVKRLKKKKASKRTISEYFLFAIIAPTLPRYSIRRQVKNFIELYNGYEWDEISKTFPIIMIVCPTLATMIYAKRMTKGLLEDEDNPSDLRIQFTTIDKIKVNGITGEIWE
ncbi:MAG: replication-relaxation family protein [Candidatus Berkelbacteria bacterium]